MSIDTNPKLASLTVPVARPAPKRFGVPVETVPESDEPTVLLTPEVIQGWAWSIGIHSLLLLVLAFWYLADKKRDTLLIETRLAGSLNGLEGGLTNTGGLDTQLGPEEGAFTSPLQPTLTDTNLGLIVVDPNLSGMIGKPNPDAGGGKDRGNPGAGDGDGFGIARFGNGGETIGGVNVLVGDPQFTLLWDTKADLDLHVIEPGGAEISFIDKQGKHGGMLDVDNTEGFGPENIYWVTDNPKPDSEKVLGRGPFGEYKWFVAYDYALDGIIRATNWRVRVKHNGQETVYRGTLKARGQHSKTYSLVIDENTPPPRPRDRFLDGVFDGIKKVAK